MAINNPIDKIVYTASLATRYDEINGYLDPLRTITLQPKFSPENISEADMQTLGLVQQQIEDYLVEREPVRLFTRESLRIQIEQETNGGGAPHGRSVIILSGCLAAVIAPLAFLPGLPHGNYIHLKAAAAAILTVFYMGAAVLFIATLPAFKSALRRAFMFICIGIAALGLSLAQILMIEAFNLNGTLYETVIAPLPFALAFAGISWGIRVYALQVGLQSRLLSSRLLVGLSTIAPLLLGPIFYFGDREEFSHPIEAFIGAVMVGWLLLFIIMAIVVLPKITGKIAELYRPPIRALGFALYSLFGVLIIIALGSSIPSLQQSDAFRLADYTLLIGTGAMFLRAGYAFNKVARY